MINRRKFTQLAGLSLLGLNFTPNLIEAEALKTLPTYKHIPILPKVCQNLFEKMLVSDGVRVEYPLDLLAPGEKEENRATVKAIWPEFNIGGDYVLVPTYQISQVSDDKKVNDISISNKIESDCLHTLLSASIDNKVTRIHHSKWQSFLKKPIAKCLVDHRINLELDSDIKQISYDFISTGGYNFLRQREVYLEKDEKLVLIISGNSDDFVMPIRQEQFDMNHPTQTGSEIVSWMELGIAVLNNRNIMIGIVK